ncbi:hypothetical protein GW17_00012214 [Ensete ventricosum]|nr:hypothetical protein GW17_00012214 [Ensete ventricosum]
MESNADSFRFAYNRPAFSDRILRIEVVAKAPEGEVDIEQDTHQQDRVTPTSLSKLISRDESRYFIDDTLHLRVELAIRQP